MMTQKKLDLVFADCPTCKVKAAAVCFRDSSGVCHAGELVRPSLEAHAHCDLWALQAALSSAAWKMSELKLL